MEITEEAAVPVSAFSAFWPALFVFALVLRLLIALLPPHVALLLHGASLPRPLGGAGPLLAFSAGPLPPRIRHKET